MRAALTSSLAVLALFTGLIACAADGAEANPDAPQPATTAEAAANVGADPSLNTRFKDADLDVSGYVKIFEGESREIATSRDAIVKALNIQPGEQLADIGAGTGLFLAPLDAAVGEGGRLYAVDISPRFLDYMRERITNEGLARTEIVACDDRSTKLAPGSVDSMFVCDTYHHFEHPSDTLASMYAALRPGGRLVIIDFDRIPGVTSEWIMGHVRCGKQQVIDEVTAAGFLLDAELTIDGLTENYVLRFVRR